MSQKPGERALKKPETGRPSDEAERRARLGELRRQREQTGHGPAPSFEFRRHGLPAPPAPQPPLKKMLKHWWEHGPFAEKPLSPAGSEERGDEKRPRSSGTLSPGQQLPGLTGSQPALWQAQGRVMLAKLNARVQEMLHQAKRWVYQRNQHQPAGVEEEVVPGLIVIGFSTAVSREEGIKRITALGGRPLRYKAALNRYQVAVPPGQEQLFIQEYLRQPDVLSADLERPSAQH
jgi:hypothetical protein